MTRSTSLARGLLLQRLAEIVGALAQFVKQPRVLDSDYSLRGEVLHQLDLLLSEWAHLLAVDGDGADQIVFLEHWHDEISASAGRLHELNQRSLACEVALLASHVSDMLQLLGLDYASEWMKRAGFDNGFALPQFDPCRGCPTHRVHPEHAVLKQHEIAEMGLTDAGRALQHRAEHGLQLARRAGDDLEHLARRGLLLQRLR